MAVDPFLIGTQSAQDSKGTITTPDLQPAQSAAEALANRWQRLRGRISQDPACVVGHSKNGLYAAAPLVAIHEEAVSAKKQFPTRNKFTHVAISSIADLWSNPSTDGTLEGKTV